MRFRAFPVSVVVDGVLHSPALLWATDEATEIYTGVDELVATLPPTDARTRANGEVLEGTDKRAKFRAQFVDGTSLLVGFAQGCGCGHPLKSWTPPKVQADA